jgi:hypothetical protein
MDFYLNTPAVDAISRVNTYRLLDLFSPREVSVLIFRTKECGPLKRAN